jgi:hypothetical protein
VADRLQFRGEIVAAHPSRVAQADQTQAAQPRKEPSAVVLRDWLPMTHVYVFNLDEICRLPDCDPFAGR